MNDRYTDGAYRAAHPDWHAEDAKHKAEGVAALLAALDWSPRTVIDVGCGTGDVLANLLTRWPHPVEAHGWDTASDPLQGAAPVPGLTLHHGDALARAQRAELVLCLDVVEHVVDDVAFMRGLAELAPRVLLRLPLDLSVLDVVRPHRLLAARDRYGHLHAYTRTTALHRAERAGLHVVAHRLHRVPPTAHTLRQRVMDRVRRVGHHLAPHVTADILGGWSLLIAATSEGPPNRTHDAATSKA